MSEQANAPRVWLRWALALALASGTVAGSIAPAFAQDDQASGEQTEEVAAEEPSFTEIVEQNLTEEIAPQAPVEEAAPAQVAVEDGNAMRHAVERRERHIPVRELSRPLPSRHRAAHLTLGVRHASRRTSADRPAVLVESF